MAETELPYTYIAKGKYWRFRRNGLDTKLPGDPGAPEFHTRYSELMAVTTKKAQVSKHSFSWLIAQYRGSAEFHALADATQLDYGKTLVTIETHLGSQPYSLTTRAMIKAVRDSFADTPRKAHKIKQMVSRLYSWADENDYIKAGLNPANGLKRLQTKGGTNEYVVWSDAEFDLFISKAIAPMICAAMIARYTGQRVKDIVRMSWADYQGDMIRVRQSKTGAQLMIRCHIRLRQYLDELKRTVAKEKIGRLLILTSAKGKAYDSNSLSSAVNREVAKIEGMPTPRSLHGLRYMSGSDMDEAGCSVGEIESVLGHQTFKMALKYASQRLRAKAAIAKVEASNNV